MVDDARVRTLAYMTSYFTTANVTEDDDATEAAGHRMYANPNYPMKLEFYGTKNNDYTMALGDPTSTPYHGHNKKPYKYNESVPISLYAVDKTGLTARKVLHKADQELKRILENTPIAAGASLRALTRTKPSDNYAGGFFLHRWDSILSYTRAAAQAQTTASISFYNGYLDDFDNGVYSSTIYAAEAGSDATHIVDATLTQGDDYWNNRTVLMLTGTYAGVEKKITDFDAATDKLTVDAFAGAIVAGDTFIISNWAETEDGNTATITTSNEDWLNITVSATGGNAVAYYSYPSEATNHDEHIDISTSTYTTFIGRYICSNANIRAKIVAVFRDTGGGETTQTVLDATNNESWTVFTITLTSGKTLDHLRVYGNNATGTVYYAFLLACKGKFTFPNIVSIRQTASTRYAKIGIPGQGGDDIQNLGTESAEFDITCDLSVSNDNDDWKRPQGSAAGKTDDNPAQVFYDIWHRTYNDPWVWIDTETMQFKALITSVNEFQEGESNMLTFHVVEVPEKASNTSYVYQRLGI